MQQICLNVSSAVPILKMCVPRLGLATSETAHKIERFDNIDNSLDNWDGSKTGVYGFTLFIFCKSEIIYVKKKET